MAERFRLILSAAPPREAKRLARKIIVERLAACVNVIKRGESHYAWHGKMTVSRESLLIAKTTGRKARKLTRFIEKNHSYDVPEVVSIPFSEGSRSYLRWIAQNTR